MQRVATGVLAVVAGVAVVAAAAWRFVPSAHAYEEPAFAVEAEHDGFEVRRYEPTIEARVTLPGDREKATRDGFRVLAGYIFGGNTARTSIDMTTPVSAAPESQSIDMTTPVSAVPEGDRWTVAFTMPAKWTLDTLPVPDDDRVQLVVHQAHRAAVRTFKGRATTRRIADEEAALQEAMAAAGVEAAGPATVAQFDPPWILGPWRRNELQVPIAP